ncbi:hypothetical protein DRO19_00285 [Candidatus Bathyarchaeota archaeon]|nr:MAG: hypothetical protein DRO19_00285 [Candidatus Bathyarchaeota archaeon]
MAEMSEDSIRPHIHPFNFFLVNRLNEIWNSMENMDYLVAIKKTFDLCLFLEPKITNGLRKELDEADRIISGRIPANEEFARQFVRSLMVLLHREGYFSLAKFQPITAESFKKLEEGEE